MRAGALDKRRVTNIDTMKAISLKPSTISKSKTIISFKRHSACTLSLDVVVAKCQSGGEAQHVLKGMICRTDQAID